MKTEDMTPIILCCGKEGRAVIYGRVEKEPVPGEAVTLHNARMIIYWTAASSGLFGVAANGPGAGSRISPTVAKTTPTRWTESISVTPEAAARIEGWDA